MTRTNDTPNTLPVDRPREPRALNRRHLLRSVATVAAVVCWGAAQAQTNGNENPTPPRMRVVIQVSDNDPAKWNLAMANAKNMQKDLGAANIDIEIVAYGPGLNMLRLDSSAAPDVSAAVKSHVSVMACGNTMHAMKLESDDLVGGVRVVPAGATEIVRLQLAGWAYLRP